MEGVIFKDLGLISYQTAWDLQTSLQKEVIDAKLQNRKLSPTDEAYQTVPHRLLFANIHLSIL